MAALSRAIERGNLEEAIELAGPERIAERLRGQGLEPGERSLKDEILSAFQEGGVAGQRQLSRRAALAASLDITNPEAVQFLRETVPNMIREVSEESREAVRQAVLRGFEEGRPARKIAREVRESIGLTVKQESAVHNLRRQLETGRLGNGQAPWNRRLSATERAQARRMFRDAVDGSPASQDKIDKIVNRYRESLINRRAKNIARTEVHRAFTQGQQELWKQAENEGLLIPELTRRVWIVTPDDRLRPSHRAIPEMNPGGVALGEKFQTPFGPVDGPSDPHEDLINCFVPGTRVRGAFVAGLESWYSGEVVEVVTARSRRLSITPNHPILTDRGFVPAGNLCEGDHLISDDFEIDCSIDRSINNQNVPARIEKVFESLSISNGIVVPGSRVDLHGDERFIQGDVRQVGADGFLKGCYYTGVRQQLEELSFVASDVPTGLRIGDRSGVARSHGITLSATRAMRSLDLMTALFLCHLRPFNPLCVGRISKRDPVFFQNSSNGRPGNSELVSNILWRGAGIVSLDDVVHIRRYPFSGHVYDLQSTSGVLSAGGIITSNCRCTVALEIDE